MKTQINEIKRMQFLAGVINESQLNEDYLELKSLAKQLYSAIKKKGYDVEIKENSQKSKFRGGDPLVGTKDSQYQNGRGGTAEIHQFSDVEEIGVFIPTYAVAYHFIKDPNNRKYLEDLIAKNLPNLKDKNIGFDDIDKYWTYIKDYAFSPSPNKSASGHDIQQNSEIKKSIASLGQELIGIIKSKKPNMRMAFKDDSVDYGMWFSEPKTAKGGTVNPNQRPNAPKPAEAPVAESFDQLDEVVDKVLAKVRSTK
jgi:hypothetical protein